MTGGMRGRIEWARFPWGLTVVTAAVMALLISLGVWQVQRLHWKMELIAASDAAAGKPPAPLAEVLSAPGEVEFRRVLALCPGASTAPFVELQSIDPDGRPGARLISVCRAPGVAAPLLLDRGFIADVDSGTEAIRPRVNAGAAMPLSILAQLRRTPPPGRLAPPPSNGRFYARDAVAMGRALGIEDAGEFTLYALASTNPEIADLKASAPPAAFSNNHFGYALTWFGLAIALTGTYLALLIRRLRVETGPIGETP